MAGNRKGIALFTVLVILGLLVVMTTSFVAINHGNFALMAAASDQEEAVGACQAGYAYAFYALEHDRRFGRDFKDPSVPWKAQLDDLDEILTASVIDKQTLSAQLTGQNGSFTLEVVNNLPDDSIKSTPKILATAAYPEVPSDCVFLRVTGRSGGVSRVLETMFTYAPLFDSSANGDNEIKINSSEGITFDSFDRFRNFVRSNGLIDLQDKHRNKPIEFRWKAMEDELLLKLTALTEHDNPKPTEEQLKKVVEDILKGRKGDLKSKGDIRVKGESTGTNMTHRVDEEKAANGRISPMSTRESKLLDIKFEDFRLTDNETTKEVKVRPGLYVFGSADYYVFYKGNAVFTDAGGNDHTVEGQTGAMAVSFPALERQEVTAATTADGKSVTKTVERWVTRENFPTAETDLSNYNLPAPPDDSHGWTFKGWEGTGPKITYVDTDAQNGEGDYSVEDEIQDRNNIHVIDTAKVKYSDIAQPGFKDAADENVIVIDINQADFRVRENTLVKSDGDFGVMAERDRFQTWWKGEGETTSNKRDLDAKIFLGVEDGSMGTPTVTYGKEPAAVQAPGNMRVRNVRGRGALVAGKDLTLAAGGDTKNDELALYAAHDIVLDPEVNLVSTTGSETEATTNTGDGGGATDYPVNCFFRGLVYAGKDFVVGNTNTSFDVLIEGSLVAKRNVDIRNAKKVNLTYNPIFSKRMLKDRPEYDVRLERQSYNLF